MRARLILVSLLILLSACVTIPDSYAPPIQRKPIDGIEPAAGKAFVRMGETSAASYIVGDVNEAIEGGGWRWTKRKPTLRLQLKRITNQKFEADLTIAANTFRETGPVSITFTINDHELARESYTEAGRHTFKKAVPAEWLHMAGDNIVTMEIDKLWTSPLDGVELGFILASAGFVE